MTMPFPSKNKSRVQDKKFKGKEREIDEILFDDEARHEYLTGFRKRNLLKKEAEKLAAQDRDRRRKRQARAEKRHALSEKARQNALQVEEAYGGGEASPKHLAANPQADLDVEYEDGEQLATVTVVEAFNVDELDELASAQMSRPRGHTAGPVEPPVKGLGDQDPPPPSKRDGAAKSAKKKRSQFHYESKAARLATRAKQHTQRKGRAEAATGTSRTQPRRERNSKQRRR